MTINESVSSVNNKSTSHTKPNEKTASSVNEQTIEADVTNDVAQQGEFTKQTDATSVDSKAQTDSTVATDMPTVDKVIDMDTPPSESEEGLTIKELTSQLAEATQKAETHWNNLLRKQAEYDNLQKRMTRDLDNARKYALEKFATDLLVIKDSMELGLEAATKPETDLGAVHEGMALTLKMMIDTMVKFGIVEINPIEEKFDPQWHEAMAMQPAPDAEDGSVLYVHQKGYQLNERLLRPARVVVVKNPAVDTEKSLENQG